MDLAQLQALGLSERWPKLAKLQREIQGLEKQLRESQQQVQQMRNALPHAEQKDLDSAAAAVRAGKEPSHTTNTDSAKRQLQAAERTASIMERAVSTARQDLAEFMQKHQAELYADVAQARAEIAASVAQAAREALVGFGQWSDMHYVLKGLEPPVEAVDASAPARDTMTIIGPAQTQRSGPDRGHVEAALNYLVSLASGPIKGDSDAA